MASLALRALRRCRRLASAPGAARLVFNIVTRYPRMFFSSMLGSGMDVMQGSYYVECIAACKVHTVQDLDELYF